MTRTTAPFGISWRDPTVWGGLVAGATFLLDQLTKIAFLLSVDRPLFTPPGTFAAGPSIEILPVFSFTLVWNQGMSYGLLQAESALGRTLYVVFTLLIVPALAWWLARTRSLIVALALGLVIGGAVGNNLVDRIAYHAVVDFLHFHVGQFNWYVFNIADTAIVFGVLLLIYDAFWGTEQQGTGRAD
jgi:signal peptidase II